MLKDPAVHLFVCMFLRRNYVNANGVWQAWRLSVSLVMGSCFGFLRRNAVRSTRQRPVCSGSLPNSISLAMTYRFLRGSHHNSVV